MTTKEAINEWYKNLELEEIIAYFNLPIDEITYESIKEVLLKNLDVQDYDSSLNIILFCGLRGMEHISPTKSLKFIEVLLQNGFNVNYCNNYFHGDNLIQFAIENGYSTEFVVNLISLTKKYNLNVNARDRSGNSIIHTSIEARSYLGEILPIMEALGENFDFNCKDKSGKDIIVKFNMCKNNVRKDVDDDDFWVENYREDENSDDFIEAEEKYDFDISYLFRLEVEEDDFRRTINKLRKFTNLSPKKDIKRKIINNAHVLSRNNIKQNTTKKNKTFNSPLLLKLNNISSQITFEFIIENKVKIDELKNELILLSGDEHLSHDDKKLVSAKLEAFNDLIQEIVTKKVESLKGNNDVNYLSNLGEQLQENGFESHQQMLKKIIDDYNTKVKNLTNTIKYNLTLKNSGEIETILRSLDNKNKNKLFNIFEPRKKQLLETVKKFKELQLSSGTFEITELSKDVYLEYNLTKLNEIIIKMQKEISNRQTEKNRKLQVNLDKDLLSKDLKLVKKKAVKKRNFPLIEPVTLTEKTTRTEILNQQEMIQQAVKIYQEQIEKIRDNITSNLTLNNIDEFREIIAILDNSNKEELFDIFEAKESKLLNLIEKMQSTPSYGMEKLPVELYSEYNFATLKKLANETKKDRFIGDTMINIRLQSEFNTILTPTSLKLLERAESQRKLAAEENQSFSSPKVKTKKK